MTRQIMWCRKIRKRKQRKFERIWIIRSRVMNFQSFIKSLLWPHMGILGVGNSASIYDVTEDNSPLVLYTDFHYFSFFIKSTFSPCLLFKYVRAEMILHPFLKELGQLLNWPFRKMKISENLCIKPMESCPLWHHRYWQSCQHHGSPYAAITRI